MLNSYEIRLKELQTELENTSSTTIKNLLQNSIYLTVNAVKKLAELSEACQKIPTLVKKSTDYLNSENEISLQDIQKLINELNNIQEFKNISIFEKQEIEKITKRAIHEIEDSIKARELIHESTFESICNEAKILPKLLTEIIFVDNPSSTDYTSAKELSKLGLDIVPNGFAINVILAILQIKNKNKENSLNANSYMERYENYNNSITLWSNAVDETIKSIAELGNKLSHGKNRHS